MTSRNSKIRKYVTVAMISILAFAGLVIVILSPLAKYLLEKYDRRYLGREVHVNRIYINPFTGFVRINDLKIYENGKDSVFFTAENVRADFAVWKLFSGEYEINDLEIENPVSYIIQKEKYLSIDDLIKRFSPDSGSNKPPVHLNVLGFKITNGKFHYIEKIIPINYFVHKINIESTGKRWDTDTIGATFNFESVDRPGIVKGNFTINTNNKDYRFATVVHNFDLEIIRQYLWELINYGMFRARLEANISAFGNFNDINNIVIKGKLAIEDFHLGKTITEDYASFKKLSLVINELSPRNKKYLFDSVALKNPFLLFERFDSLDNVQAMFGKEASNISDITSQEGRFNLVIQISRYIEGLSKRFLASHYEVNALSITQGDLKFSDYSLSQQFSIGAENLSFKADSITKSNKRVKFYLQADIYPYGNTSATLSINPLDSGDLDLHYVIEKMPVSVFNPYLINYTSYPLNKGTLALSGAWKVRGNQIKSTNHMLLVDPQVGSRIKRRYGKWIPLPFIMAFVRERANIIDYKIPISGNLKNPKFHLSDVVIDLFENIFIKPPTLPYGLEVRNAENAIESAMVINWKMGQSMLEGDQRRFINKMARFLKKNKGSSIDVYPQHYALKEKEYLLFFETKKKYFLVKQGKKELSSKDSIALDRASVKDLSMHLVKDLIKITRDTTMFTIQDRCNYFLGDNTVELSYRRLIAARERSLRSILIQEGVDKQVTIHASEDLIPFNGFSSFKIHYNGALPKSLQDSYDKLSNLNSHMPRKKYFKSSL
jgi:hypothetical protein